MGYIPLIPYFQTSRYRVQTMVELAQPKPNEKGADLGSGDGRIVLAFSKIGIEMHGYELDQKLRTLSEELIYREKLTNAYIHNTDFWYENLSQYDIICCYPMPDIMGRLENKLQNELHSGARVLLNYYPFPHWKEIVKKDNIYLYLK